MKNIVRSSIFLGLVLVLLAAASCKPVEINWHRDTPEENLKVMRTALEKDDYTDAYYCLSRETRQRYSFSNFRLMLEYTIFGILIRNMLINWTPKSVEFFTEIPKPTTEGGPAKPIEKARVILQHWKYPEYTKEFIFVYEDGWRIELTMAHILGVPQADEDTLFPGAAKLRK